MVASGVTSSAPMSGVVGLRNVPSKSMLIPAMGVPAPVTGEASIISALGSMCRSLVGSTKIGSASIEFASSATAACQAARAA